jgi:hypothetical protein
MTEFAIGINPSLPLAVYTCKQEKCQSFANDAAVPISEAMMVTTGTKEALTRGGMTLAWHEWKRHPTNKQTWNNWKAHWTAAFSEARDINRITAGNNVFANQAAADAEQVARMATSLNNLTNATIQKNDTVDKLVAANEKLAKALANANAAIARLRLPAPTATPSISTNATNRPRPAHWSPVKPDWDLTGYC